MKTTSKFLGDIREQPAYSMQDAARYLHIPYPTLRDWVRGFPRSKQKAIIHLPDKTNNLLSFINLVEIHVLDAIRRDHGISFPKIRKALSFLEKHYPSEHPLADNSFATDGLHLFIEEYGRLINISKDGQEVMRTVLEAYLDRIQRDKHGIPIRLFPFVKKKSVGEPKRIIIDPSVSFGRPVLAGTGIPTAVIYERFVAGDSTPDLATDYDVDQNKVEDAIRCEQQARAA